ATISSHVLRVGDVVSVSESDKKNPAIIDSIKTLDRRGAVRWLSLDRENLKGTVTALPERDDVTVPINEQLIVELYSK
ncbi:MAG: 30S ribosomal protein S4, partial [Deltaproteobacteria bacterium]|nr:30S ribosomal protein S4 [Deltaproteobacteria bacterium]